MPKNFTVDLTDDLSPFDAISKCVLMYCNSLENNYVRKGEEKEDFLTSLSYWSKMTSFVDRCSYTKYRRRMLTDDFNVVTLTTMTVSLNEVNDMF